MNVFEQLTDTYNHNNETIKEFDKRFNHSILALKEEDKIVYLLYSHFDKYPGTFFFQDIITKKTHLIPWDHKENLNLYIPILEKGWYNLTNPKYNGFNIYYITKVAKRRWRRGICTDTYRCENLTPMFNIRLPEISKLTYEEIFGSVLYNKNDNFVSEYLFLGCDLDHYRVINPNLLLIKKENRYLLYFHKYLAGYFETPKKFIMTTKVFHQETLEEFQKWPLTFHIQTI